MAVKPYREIALTVAQREVGVKEEPAGSNYGPRVSQYESVTGAFREPWCASFVQWCFKQAGMPQPFMSKSAYVPFILDEAKKAGWVVPAAKVEPGDLVCFDWDHNSVPDHIGFVTTRVNSHGEFNTVEGNTAEGNDSNGGQVMHRVRSISEVAGFIRVPGGKPVAKPKPVVKVKPAPDVHPEPKNEAPFKVAPFWAWVAWEDGGAPPAKRPANVPAKIPAAWWVRYAIHKGIKRAKRK